MPRSALMVLARAVRQAMELSAHDAKRLGGVDALIADATTAQACIVRSSGAMVWPPAAVALRWLARAPEAAELRERCSTEWAAEGLQRSEFGPTALSLAPILEHASALYDHDHAGVTLTGPMLLDMLAAAEREGSRPWGMMATLLVIRVPQETTTLLATADGKVGLRSMAEVAAETALAWLESETADQTCSIGESAPTEIGRQAALLEALGAQPVDNARRRRLAEARVHLLGGCLGRLETSLHHQISEPLAELPTEPAARNAALDAVEASARTLRRFEVEARRIGAASKFDALVHAVEQSVSATAELGPMDRGRGGEIFAGPAAAARQLRA